MRTSAHYLWDIIEATDALNRFLTGKTLVQFEQDEILRAAIHSKLLIIGEAVCQLPESLTDKYPAIPWHTVRAFRNIAIHGYFKIDWEIMWVTATKDAALLATTASEMLEKEYPHFRTENM